MINHPNRSQELEMPRYEITPQGGSMWGVTLYRPGERPEYLCSVESGDGPEYDEDDVLAAALDVRQRLGSRGIEEDGIPVYVDGVQVR